MTEKISPKEWLSQNKGKTLNDYYKLFPNNNNAVFEEKEYNKPLHQSINNSTESISKKSWINIAICVIGIIGFFLPWIDIQVMGFSVTSISGYAIPKISGGITQMAFYMDSGTYSNGFNIMYTLYLIPLAFGLIAYGEFSNKNVFHFFLTLIIIGCTAFFLYKPLSVTEIEKVFSILGIGIYLTAGAAIVLLVRKIGD